MHTFIAHCQSEGRTVLRLVRVIGASDEDSALQRVRAELEAGCLSPADIEPASNDTKFADLQGLGMPCMGMRLIAGDV